MAPHEELLYDPPDEPSDEIPLGWFSSHRRRDGDRNGSGDRTVEMRRERAGGGGGDDDDPEDDPENTRDILWQWVKRDLKQRELAAAATTEALNALRKSQAEQDRRHIDAQITVAREQVAARRYEAEKAAEARKLEAKVAGGLGGLLILGLLAVAGVQVAGKVLGQDFAASPAASPGAARARGH